MWERRHGFPEPERLPKGHRRYSKRDIELVRRVASERAAGVSLPLAIERATRDIESPPRRCTRCWPAPSRPRAAHAAQAAHARAEPRDRGGEPVAGRAAAAVRVLSARALLSPRGGALARVRARRRAGRSPSRTSSSCASRAAARPSCRSAATTRSRASGRSSATAAGTPPAWQAGSRRRAPPRRRPIASSRRSGASIRRSSATRARIYADIAARGRGRSSPSRSALVSTRPRRSRRASSCGSPRRSRTARSPTSPPGRVSMRRRGLTACRETGAGTPARRCAAPVTRRLAAWDRAEHAIATLSESSRRHPRRRAAGGPRHGLPVARPARRARSRSRSGSSGCRSRCRSSSSSIGVPVVIGSAIAFRWTAELDRRNAAWLLGRPIRGALPRARPRDARHAHRDACATRRRRATSSGSCCTRGSGFTFGCIALGLVFGVAGLAVLPAWFWSLPDDGADFGLLHVDTVTEALAVVPLAVPRPSLTVVAAARDGARRERPRGEPARRR